MSSEGPKMVEKELCGGLKWPKMAGKVKNSPMITVAPPPLRRPDPGGSGGGWP